MPREYYSDDDDIPADIPDVDYGDEPDGGGDE